MALVDIFENVLDSLDRGNRLDVNVASILPDEIFVVANHPSVVDMISSNLSDLTSVRAPSSGITVICDSGMLHKGLGKSSYAFSVLHTGRIRVMASTGPMNHKFLNKFK